MWHGSHSAGVDRAGGEPPRIYHDRDPPPGSSCVVTTSGLHNDQSTCRLDGDVLLRDLGGTVVRATHRPDRTDYETGAYVVNDDQGRVKETRGADAVYRFEYLPASTRSYIVKGDRAQLDETIELGRLGLPTRQIFHAYSPPLVRTFKYEPKIDGG
jgi:hypothetical protein